MARLNITVPQDLFDALKPYRDRINMSKVCADALYHKVYQCKQDDAIVNHYRAVKNHLTTQPDHLHEG